MKLTIVVFITLIIGVVIFSWQEDEGARKDWNGSVELAKQIKQKCDRGYLNPILVPPPHTWNDKNPRIVLMGEEINLKKLETLQFFPGSGGFRVVYDGRVLGFCSIQ